MYPEQATPSIDAGEVTTTNPTNDTGLNSALAAASGQAQAFLDQVNTIQADLEAERDRLAEELANCHDLKRDCNGDGIHDVNDLPAVMSGDLIVTEDGSVQDPDTGLAISPNNP